MGSQPTKVPIFALTIEVDLESTRMAVLYNCSTEFESSFCKIRQIMKLSPRNPWYSMHFLRNSELYSTKGCSNFIFFIVHLSKLWFLGCPNTSGFLKTRWDNQFVRISESDKFLLKNTPKWQKNLNFVDNVVSDLSSKNPSPLQCTVVSINSSVNWEHENLCILKKRTKHQISGFKENSSSELRKKNG